MTSQTVAALVLVAGIVVPAGAVQTTDVRQQPSGTNASPARPAEEPARLLTNVQVELTVTDTMASAAPLKKTVTMMIAEGRMGRIRSAREQSTAVLNVDATPTIFGNQIRLQMTLEYSPPLSSESATRVAHVSETVTLMLASGKPTLVSRAADPAADRTVSVEVTATILK